MLTLEQLPDDFTTEQFLQLDKISLDKIPYQRKFLLCQVKNCKHGTHIRDYGLNPLYFLDRNSKGAFKNPVKYWWNIRFKCLLCDKHYKLYKRLVKLYGLELTRKKLYRSDKVIING